MMGTSTTTEVLEIAQRPARAGVFAVPSGYAKRDRLDMEAAQRK